jgi:hypothetical protein
VACNTLTVAWSLSWLISLHLLLLLLLPPCLRSPTGRAHFQRRPTYSAHLLANKLFDQDNVSADGLQQGLQYCLTRP